MGDGGGGYDMGANGSLNKRSSPPKEYNRKLSPADQRQKDINSSLDLGQMPSINIKDWKDCASPPNPITLTTCCSPLPLPIPRQLQSPSRWVSRSKGQLYPPKPTPTLKSSAPSLPTHRTSCLCPSSPQERKEEIQVAKKAARSTPKLGMAHFPHPPPSSQPGAG